MDYSKEKASYYQLPLSEKRVNVLALLKWLEGKAEVFDVLYQHILNEPQSLIESEVDEVYESIMSVLIEDSTEKMQASLDHLNEINDRLNIMRENERKEREMESATEVLAIW